MKNIFKTIGVVITTGVMAIAGFIGGMITFRPDCVTIGNTDNKDKGAE